MPFVADSRKPRVGAWPLQDHGSIKRGDPSNRAGLIAARILDRDPRDGRWVYQASTVGDVVGGYVWPAGGGGTATAPTSVSSVSGPIQPFPAFDPGGKGAASDGRTRPAWFFAVGVRVVATSFTDRGRGGTSAKPGLMIPGVGIAGAGGLGGIATVSTQNIFRGDGKNLVRPIRDRLWIFDGDLEQRRPATPEEWPTFPGGFSGIVVAGTGTKNQVEHFHPTDPRIVAPNFSGPVDTASLVVDLDKKTDEIDVFRQAPVTSFWRVIWNPSIRLGDRLLGRQERRTVSRSRGASKKATNLLSWTLGASGQKDTRGGLINDQDATGTSPNAVVRETVGFPTIDAEPSVTFTDLSGFGSISTTRPREDIDTQREDEEPQKVPFIFRVAPRPTGAKTIIAAMSIHDGGPIDVGGFKDPHGIGIDGDGNPINAAHISTEALYRKRQVPRLDGPICFEDDDYPEVEGFSHPVEAFLAFDAPSGYWRLWSTSSLYTYGGQPPIDTPPTTVEPPTGPPTRPPDLTVFIVGSAGTTPVPLLGTMRETSFPSLSFRPQLLRKGVVDFRYTGKASRGQVAAYDRETPLVGRLTAYGAQGGKTGGDYLGPETGGTGAEGPFKVNEAKEKSRFGVPTAAGGLVFLPPEVDLQDIDELLDPPQRSPSTSYFGFGPNTRAFFGTPELATGGVKNGWTLGIDTTTLKVREHDSTGTDTDRVDLEAGGSLKLQTGLFKHSVDTSVAAGSGQGAVTLARGLNVITDETAGNDVTLPAVSEGAVVVVAQGSGISNIDVFPASGETINALAADTSINTDGTARTIMFIGGNGGWWAIQTA